MLACTQQFSKKIDEHVKRMVGRAVKLTLSTYFFSRPNPKPTKRKSSCLMVRLYNKTRNWSRDVLATFLTTSV